LALVAFSDDLPELALVEVARAAGAVPLLIIDGLATRDRENLPSRAVLGLAAQRRRRRNQVAAVAATQSAVHALAHHVLELVFIVVVSPRTNRMNRAEHVAHVGRPVCL